MDIKFHSREEVLVIHADLLFHYGGSAGIRDEGLLDSALAMPAAGFGDQFLHPDIPSMAAAYLFHLVQNHPFVDGNKRTGSAVALVFLDTNDYEFIADEDTYESLVWQVARSEISKEEVILFFHKYTISPVLKN